MARGPAKTATRSRSAALQDAARKRGAVAPLGAPTSSRLADYSDARGGPTLASPELTAAAFLRARRRSRRMFGSTCQPLARNSGAEAALMRRSHASESVDQAI